MIMHKDQLIIVTEDHGGYKAGRCVLCDQRGWIDAIDHLPECPIRVFSTASLFDVTPRNESEAVELYSNHAFFNRVVDSVVDTVRTNFLPRRYLGALFVAIKKKLEETNGNKDTQE